MFLFFVYEKTSNFAAEYIRIIITMNEKELIDRVCDWLRDELYNHKNSEDRLHPIEICSRSFYTVDELVEALRRDVLSSEEEWKPMKFKLSEETKEMLKKYE